jgi:integrase-like protein
MPGARGLCEVSREKMRTRHFAYRTEQAYLYWIRRCVNFHGRKHPREMGSCDVEAFLTQRLAADESLRLRVKDLVIERGELIVRDAKGGKDRVTVFRFVFPVNSYACARGYPLFPCAPLFRVSSSAAILSAILVFSH